MDFPIASGFCSGSSSANKFNQLDLSVVFVVVIGFGLGLFDAGGTMGLLFLFIEVNNSLSSDDGRKLLFVDSIGIADICC